MAEGGPMELEELDDVARKAPTVFVKLKIGNKCEENFSPENFSPEMLLCIQRQPFIAAS